MARRRLRRLVTRGRVKWVGTIAAAMLATVYVASLWHTILYWHSTPHGMIIAALGSGRVGYLCPDYETSSAPWSDFDLVSRSSPRAFAWFDWGESRPRFFSYDASLAVPLWLPLLLIAAPTAYIWYTDSRAKPWQCPKCRYDLRGLDGGVCPECGETVATDT